MENCTTVISTHTSWTCSLRFGICYWFYVRLFQL